MIKTIAWGVLGLLVVAVLGIWLIIVPSQLYKATRMPFDTSPSKFRMAYKNVTFPAIGDHLMIRGWWMPAAHARAVLVLVHGANANRRYVYAKGIEIAKALVDNQISVLAIDLRNHGASDSSPDGKLTFGIDESKDVNGAVDFVVARAPGLPVYLMGISMGGAAVIYAAFTDVRVKRIALIDPILDRETATANGLQAMLGWPRWMLAPMLWSADEFFAPKASPANPFKLALGLHIPVLLIQDDRDPICEPVYAKMLAAHNHNVTLWISHDPGPNNPDTIATGGWGSHVAAFRLHPHEMTRELSNFLEVIAH